MSMRSSTRNGIERGFLTCYSALTLSLFLALSNANPVTSQQLRRTSPSSTIHRVSSKAVTDRIRRRVVLNNARQKTVASQVAMPSEIGVRPVNTMEDMLKAKFEKYAPEKREPTVEVMKRAISEQIEAMNGNRQLRPVQLNADQLDNAYGVAEAITDEYAKTFSLGLRLMEKEKQKAVWAIYVWCRRTDELVDGSIASHITPTTLNKWEERLDKIFEGYAFDALDATLADTAAKFPIGKQGFKDMIEGMRMDLYKSRYQNFEELKEYCYRVAGTVGLMTTPVMGISKDSVMSDTEVLNSAVALGIALQLTNILRDVGEDAQQRDRIYLPLDELADFGLTEADILSGKVDDRWRDFMKFQIKRAREYFAIAKSGIASLDPSVRWAVWGAGMVYGEILDAIEKNDYDNLTRRAYVPRWRKFQLLPVALVQTLLMKPQKD